MALVSKIDDMIARLCPDGVEHVSLDEAGTLTRGKRFVRSDFVEHGTHLPHNGTSDKDRRSKGGCRKQAW